MVSQNTIDIINYSKDLDYEYNFKLILLFGILIYAVSLFWLTFKWDKDKFYISLIKNFLIRIPAGIYIFFFPLISIYTLREASWELIYTLLIVFYSYSFIILMIAGKLGFFEFLLALWGFKFSPKTIKTKEGSNW